jgi:hypothetical protein
MVPQCHCQRTRIPALFNVHNPAQFLRSSPERRSCGRAYRFSRVSVSNLGVYDLRDRPIDNEVTFPDEFYEHIRQYVDAEEAVQAFKQQNSRCYGSQLVGGHTLRSLP